MEHSRRKPDYKHYYSEYLFGRRTLKNIATNLNISVKTLRNYFDDIEVNYEPKPAGKEAINLVLDATFFGREYGYFSFHNTKKIIYAKEIKIESLAELNFCLDKLVQADYKFKSFTLDGKRGFISQLKKRFPGVPVQMCVLHQKMIVRRYITNNPNSDCGLDIKQLMKDFLQDSPQEFDDKFKALQEKHKTFLAEKNKKGKFKHEKVRSAVRSIKTNMHLLFEYKHHPDLNIPRTSNHIEGAFSHLKEKITLHRGLNIKRKKKAIMFLLMEGK